MKKIAVIGMRSFDNIGDILLCDSVDWLVKKIANTEVVQLDMTPIYSLRLHLGQKIIRWMLNFLYRGFKKFFKNSEWCWCFGYLEQVYIQRIYGIQKKTQDVDGIIMACGMLKYETQELDFIYEYLISLCEKRNISFMLDAVGVEAINTRNARARHLKAFLKKPCVKMITTREGKRGVDLLKTNYELTNVDIRAVGDPAFWIDECYGIKKTAETGMVGIGIIRPTIFTDYGKEFEAQRLELLYKKLFNQLEKDHIKWKVFCNGLVSDYLYAEQWLEEEGIPKERLAPRPTTGEELVKQIAEFDLIMGARLHACITAYSLDIPAVGFIWTDKVRYVTQVMGNEKYFLDENNLKVETLYDMIMSIKDNPYNYTLMQKEEWKSKTAISIKAFVESVQKNH